MKRQDIAYTFILLAISIVMPYSCKLGLGEEEWEGISGEVQDASELELFEHSADTGEYKLYTTDKRFSRLYGSSLWLPLRDNSQDPFDFWEVEVAKRSGERNAGYGVVLCQQRDTGGVDSMLTVMIRVDQYYQIGEVKEKEYTRLVGWKRTNNLKEGYGISNRIRVERGISLF